MSASREKKQRQGGTSVDKAQAAKQEAAAAKRKTIQYTVIGVVVAVLVVALLVWDSGLIQRSATAATIGSEDYSVAEVNYYYYSVYQYTAIMAQYGMSTYDTSVAPEDQVYSSNAETGETLTYDDYFRQTALEELTSVAARYDAAIADGYSEADVKDTVDAEIDSTESSAISNGYASLKQYLAASYGKYVTPSVYRDILTRQAIAELYKSDYTSSLEYTDADLEAYYDENADTLDTFEYSYLYFAAADVETTDADGNDLSEEDIAAAEEQAMADAKTKADEVAAALEDGASVADLAEEYEPSSSSESSVSLGSSLNSIYSEWLQDSGRQAGDVGVLEYTDYGYYVVVFNDRYLDETPSADVRHILIKAELTEDDPNTEEDESADEPTDEQMAAAKAKAEEILAEWEAGDATEESFAALADEYSEDGRGEDGSLNAPGGLYEGVYEGSFVTNFNDWIFDGLSRKAGDVDIIENDGDSSYYGYHIAYFIGYNEGDYAWKSTVRSTLANNDTTEWQEGLEANVTVTEQSGMSFVG